MGLDTPGPASAAGMLSARGSTNFVHANWAGFDIREGLAHKLGKPVTYLNDGNAAALWGHYAIFGANSKETSISTIIGTGNGGGIILEGNVVKGKNGFGGELGHVLIPYQSIAGIAGMVPQMQLRTNRRSGIVVFVDRRLSEIILPFFLPKYAGHELEEVEANQAAKRVRGMADKRRCAVQRCFSSPGTCAGLFFDEMINTFDPDALIVGGGALEASAGFQKWFMDEIRNGMPNSAKSKREFRSMSSPMVIRRARAARRLKRSSWPGKAGLM